MSSFLFQGLTARIHLPKNGPSVVEAKISDPIWRGSHPWATKNTLAWVAVIYCNCMIQIEGLLLLGYGNLVFTNFPDQFIVNGFANAIDFKNN